MFRGRGLFLFLPPVVRHDQHSGTVRYHDGMMTLQPIWPVPENAVVHHEPADFPCEKKHKGDFFLVKTLPGGVPLVTWACEEGCKPEESE